jgi:hypothetical protein
MSMSSTISARTEMKLGDLANVLSGGVIGYIVRLLEERRAELRRLRGMRDRYIANAQANLVLQLTNSGVWECFRKSGLRNSMSVNCLAFAAES